MIVLSSEILFNSKLSGKKLLASNQTLGSIRTVVAISWVLRAFSTSASFLTGFKSVAMKLQTRQTKIPTADTQTGKRRASHSVMLELPMTRAAQVASAKLPKRSLPIPATSPTLSPTLSAMVAGLRGSSSGMPWTTFPTRSAPTSAALV